MNQQAIIQPHPPPPSFGFESEVVLQLQGLYEDLNIRIPAATSSHTELTLSPSYGFDCEVVLQGLYEDLNIRIPAGTSSHTELTLSVRGLRHQLTHHIACIYELRIRIGGVPRNFVATVYPEAKKSKWFYAKGSENSS